MDSVEYSIFSNKEQELLMNKINVEIDFYSSLPNILEYKMTYKQIKKLFKKKLLVHPYFQHLKIHSEFYNQQSYSNEEILEQEWKDYFEENF